MGWLCCRTVLIALRETCVFTTARAATSVAANAARVPHGRAAVVRRRRSLTNGDSRDKATCIHGRLAYAFVRLCRPKAPLREPFLPRLLGDARSTLPILALACVLRGKRRARTPAVKDSFNTILERAGTQDTFKSKTLQRDKKV